MYTDKQNGLSYFGPMYLFREQGPTDKISLWVRGQGPASSILHMGLAYCSQVPGPGSQFSGMPYNNQIQEI